MRASSHFRLSVMRRMVCVMVESFIKKTARRTRDCISAVKTLLAGKLFLVKKLRLCILGDST